jgi:hypothetical protein
MRIRVLAACAAGVLATTPSLQAQSTFDGDITAQGRSQVAIDMLSYVAPSASGGWVWFNPRVYHGFAHRIEVGAGFSGYSHQVNGGPSALQPSLKWRALSDTVHHLTLSAGAQSLVATQQGVDSYGLTFVSLDSWLNHSEHAAGAVAVGSYTLVGRDAASSDSRQGAIVSAWEAAGPVRVSGSWLSGQNFYGYRTGAVTYTTATSRWFTVGYSVGNAAFHNAGPYFSTGRAF